MNKGLCGLWRVLCDAEDGLLFGLMVCEFISKENDDSSEGSFWKRRNYERKVQDGEGGFLKTMDVLEDTWVY
jgi:hypothetical protein